MRRGARAAVLAAATFLLAGCGDSSPGSEPAPTVPAPTTTVPASTTTVRATTTTTGVVPNVVGKDLATARALLTAAGYTFNPHDGTQKGRTPADDWIVYRQSPEAGYRGNTQAVVYLELLRRGERYVSPGTSPCPRFAQC